MLWRAVKPANGVLPVTADHFNADEMYEYKGDKVLTGADGHPLPRTCHSQNPVPFLVLDPRGR